MLNRAVKCGRISSAPYAKLARAAGLALLLGGAAMPAGGASALTRMPAPSIVRAKPAMWAVRDADTTIYLFGTFHTLDGRTVWFDDKVRQAFDHSAELVLETVVPADAADLKAAARVVETESSDGTRQPKAFIAQTQVAVSHGKTLGLSIDNGADAVLRRVADDLGKPVGGLERFAEQLGTLATIPASAVPSQASQAPRIAVTVGDLLAAWTIGNTDAFSTMLAGFEAKAPLAYRMLIADRNAKWGQWIADRMQRPGTVFVAVGTGHLAGKDSVQQWLAMRGIASVRVS